MAMLIGQLSGRKSLRDITDNLKAKKPFISPRHETNFKADHCYPMKYRQTQRN